MVLRTVPPGETVRYADFHADFHRRRGDLTTTARATVSDDLLPKEGDSAIHA
jgi:hypothetical protein